MKRLLLAVLLAQQQSSVPEFDLIKAQLLRTRMELAQQRYINAANDMDKAKAEYDKYSEELVVHIERLYSKMNLKPDEYNINIDTGVITPVKKEKP